MTGGGFSHVLCSTESERDDISGFEHYVSRHSTPLAHLKPDAFSPYDCHLIGLQRRHLVFNCECNLPQVLPFLRQLLC